MADCHSVKPCMPAPARSSNTIWSSRYNLSNIFSASSSSSARKLLLSWRAISLTTPSTIVASAQPFPFWYEQTLSGIIFRRAISFWMACWASPFRKTLSSCPTVRGRTPPHGLPIQILREHSVPTSSSRNAICSLHLSKYTSRKIFGRRPSTGIAKPVARAFPFPCATFFRRLFSSSGYMYSPVRQSYLKG